VLEEGMDGMIARRRTEPGGHHDLLSMFMEARDEDTGEAMSDRQLRDEIITMYAAGHETTTNALTWTLMLLAEHPDIAQRLQAELDEVLQGRTPVLENLGSLPFTEQVIMESMRLYPPVPLVSRRVIEDDEIGGYRIPKDSLVFLSPYITHRDPRVWPEPKVFDPDRFSSERVKSIPKIAYFPFLAGPRQCIGKGVAMMETTILVAAIAQYYRFEPAPGFVVETDVAVALRPKNGLMLAARRRTPHRVKRRLDAYDPDGTRTRWMKTSAIAHYWMARRLSEVTVDEAPGGTPTVRIETQFPCADFTLRLDRTAQRMRIDGIDLRRVQSRTDFRSGTYLVEGDDSYAAFDLGNGVTTLTTVL